MSVRDFMTKNVITVHSAMPIFDAIDLMKNMTSIDCRLLISNG